MLAVATQTKIAPCPFADSCQIASLSCEAKDAEYCKPIFNKKPQLRIIKSCSPYEAKLECPNCGNTDRKSIETNNGNGPIYTCNTCGSKRAMVCFIKTQLPQYPTIKQD